MIILDQTSLVRSLLTANASLLDAKDAVRCIIQESTKYFDLLIVIEQDGRTSLHVAASSGGLDVIRYLIDQKADVNAKDAMGWTPLMIAGTNFDYNHLELTKSYSSQRRA